MHLDLGYLAQHRFEIASGLGVTCLVSILAIATALVGGIVGGAVRTYRIPILNWIVIAFVEFIRNTPLLLQIFFLFFVVPQFSGIRLSPFLTAYVALAMWGSAYNVENFRAGFEAVERDISEASIALGFTRIKTFWHVILPLGFRIALRSVLNISISVLKNSSYMVVIGFPELTDVVYHLATLSFRVFELFGLLGVLYLALVSGVSFIASRVEQRLGLPYKLSVTAAIAERAPAT